MSKIGKSLSGQARVKPREEKYLNRKWNYEESPVLVAAMIPTSLGSKVSDQQLGQRTEDILGCYFPLVLNIYTPLWFIALATLILTFASTVKLVLPLPFL